MIHVLTVLFPTQVLRFYAYFQEAVHEKREEQYRVRNSVILFYLEDDTIQVNEPSMTNSGLPQGWTLNTKLAYTPVHTERK